MNVYKRIEPVDWKLCTCDRRYAGGQAGPMEGVQWDVTREIVRLDPNCPERAKQSHPQGPLKGPTW